MMQAKWCLLIVVDSMRLQVEKPYMHCDLFMWLPLGKPVLSPIYKYQEMLVLNIQGIVAWQWW